MKITTLATTLLLGVSSVAAADAAQGPAVRVSGQVYVGDEPRAVYRPEGPRTYDRGRPWYDRRDDRRDGRRGQHWTLLSRNARMNYDGRQFVTVQTPERFDWIQIDGVRGYTRIERVGIVFGNGRTQVVDINQTVNRDQPVYIDLNGNDRRVKRVIVYGRGSRGATYNVLAT